MNRIQSNTLWTGLGLTALAALIVVSPEAALAVEPGDAGTHGFDWGIWLTNVINFLIFLGILWYFAAPKVKEYFVERRKELLADLEEAKRLRQEAEARLEEYKAKLDTLEGKREELLAEYEAQGEREKERLIEEAKSQIAKMREDAEATIDQEVKKAVSDLEKQAVDLAVEMARDLADEKLERSEQNALLEKYVDDLNGMSGERATS